MTNINFTRNDLNAVANVAYAKAGQNNRLARAIDRALLMLAKEQWSFDGLHFVVRSSDGSQTYTVIVTEPMTCGCKGRQSGHWCKHIVGARLLVRAAEHYAHPRQDKIDYSLMSRNAHAAYTIINEYDICE